MFGLFKPPAPAAPAYSVRVEVLGYGSARLFADPADNAARDGVFAVVSGAAGGVAERRRAAADAGAAPHRAAADLARDRLAAAEKAAADIADRERTLRAAWDEAVRGGRDPEAERIAADLAGLAAARSAADGRVRVLRPAAAAAAATRDQAAHAAGVAALADEVTAARAELDAANAELAAALAGPLVRVLAARSRFEYAVTARNSPTPA